MLKKKVENICHMYEFDRDIAWLRRVAANAEINL
jgi:hypothetical protein